MDSSKILEVIGVYRNHFREGRIEKAFRWLGFVQGCLWATGQYTLDELKNHNRP